MSFRTNPQTGLIAVDVRINGKIYAMTLSQVGALAAGESKIAGNRELFDWYSAENPVPVMGWIAGDVLKTFRLTVDYPNHVLYWLRQRTPELMISIK